MNNRILQTLSIRRFSFLLIAELFSQIAINTYSFSLLIVVFTVANTNTAVSGAVLAFMIPTLLFGILAGVYVDRWNKKSVLIYSNVLRAIVLIPLAFFHSNLIFVYFMTFIVSTITQFFIPAETPIIPLLVKKKLLLSANALFGIGVYASIFLAYALSGPLILILGKNNIFIFLAACFLLAGFFASLIKYKETSLKKPKENESIEYDFMEELKMALGLITKTKKIYHAIFSMSLAQVLILMIAVIGPGYAVSVLKIKVEDFPLMFVTPAIAGLALGAVIIGNYFHRHDKTNLTKFGLLMAGICLLFFPYGSKVESRAFVHTINYYLPRMLEINILHIMVVLAFALGFAMAFVFIPANTILQEETSDEIRGKIYGVSNSFVGAISILPVVLVGGFADLFGVKSVITGLGITVILIALIRFIRDRK